MKLDILKGQHTAISKLTSRMLLLGRGVGRATEGNLGQDPGGTHFRRWELTTQERGVRPQTA